MIVPAIINVGAMEAVLMVSIVSLVIVSQVIPEITVLLVSKVMCTTLPCSAHFSMLSN